MLLYFRAISAPQVLSECPRKGKVYEVRVCMNVYMYVCFYGLSLDPTTDGF